MFLCHDCHDLRKHFEMFHSYGRCEACGKKRACIDCRYIECHAPLKKKDKKETRGGQKIVLAPALKAGVF